MEDIKRMDFLWELINHTIDQKHNLDDLDEYLIEAIKIDKVSKDDIAKKSIMTASELSTELLKSLDNKENKYDLLSYLADMFIAIRAIEAAYDIDGDLLDKAIDIKIDKLIKKGD